MNSQITHASPGSIRVGLQPGEVGEIFQQPEHLQRQPVLREFLLPEQLAVSLPGSQVDLSSPINQLTKFLGPSLTVASPAWAVDPIPAMRSLEKLLVEHSLKLPENERRSCLEAISIVEKAVLWRLRFQQMRMNEVELETSEGRVTTERKPEREAA